MSAFHDEVMLPGGVYWEGEKHTDSDRTDLYIEGSGKGEEDNPHTLALNITTAKDKLQHAQLQPR